MSETNLAKYIASEYSRCYRGEWRDNPENGPGAMCDCGGYLKDFSPTVIENDDGKEEHIVEINFWCGHMEIAHHPDFLHEIKKEEMDTNCQVCGAIDLWPCCSSCEREGKYF